ncbi:MAG: HAMP domain-containing histidine kinase [Bifidobacteriaceae bacterium]|jgi:two-component system sensor histidine kinase SenX3|nr:HAMP domain-containing histidine kinase [Bifidobacteriaceae bacterium]
MAIKNALFFRNKRLQRSNDEVDDAVISIISALKQGAIFLNSDGEIIRASSKAYKLGVINDDEISEKSLFELFSKTVKTNKSQEGEIEINRHTAVGLPQKAFLSVRCIRITQSQYIILITDITEAKQLEEARQTLIDAITLFVKKPIKKIRKNFKELSGDLACSVEKSKECELIYDLESQTQNLYHTLNSIIQFTKSLGGPKLSKSEIIRVADIVNSAVSENSFASQRFGVKIKIVKNSSVKIVGVLDHIASALSNIINNAIIYSEPNSKVYIESKCSEEKVEIIVSDKGSGIDDKDLPHIFERFYKGQSDNFDNSKSIGLGLAIAKHIIQNYGGQIQVYSQKNKGSVFVVSFPIAEEG